MRKTIKKQMKIGEIDISKIKIELDSRDEIPQLLLGLKAIYTDTECREEVFDILRGIIPAGIDINNGRPGMDLWEILVLGTLRLNSNWDYDKLQNIANHHATVREMLGYTIYERDEKYGLQTLKDNISLFTPEVLDKISTVVVRLGHKVVGKKEGDALKGRGDSFVVETNVHHPTDIHLLLDAIRKILFRIRDLGVTGWRQYNYNFKKIKMLFNKVRRLKRSNSKDEKKKEKREWMIIEAHKKYVELAEIYMKRGRDTIESMKQEGNCDIREIKKIEGFIVHGERQIEQISRRVIKGEKIPHKEKVFSIFEPHTEWISKGKAGVPQELGLRVGVIEDQYSFILNHRVMENETDDKVAVDMILETKKKFKDFNSCSFDKGFYSSGNKSRLKEKLGVVIMPKKGRCTKEELEIERSEWFVKGRKVAFGNRVVYKWT